MAQKQTVTYVSDLSGADITDNDAPTIQFGWDGTDYTIDLTAKEAEAFYKAVSKYIDAGTKVSKSNKRTKKTATGPNAADVRGWAKDNGYDVPQRGRIPSDVMDAYNAAN